MATVVDLIFSELYAPPGAVAVDLRFGPPEEVLPGTPMFPAGTRLAWGRADLGARQWTGLAWGRNTDTVSGGARLPWGRAGAVAPRITSAAWGASAQLPRSVRAPWGASSPMRREVGLPWQRAAGAGRAASAPWGRAQGAGAGATAAWGAAAPARASAGLPWGAATPARIGAGVPWGRAGSVFGEEAPPPLPIVLPPSPVREWVNLHFCRPLEADRLHFNLGVDPCAGVILPPSGTLIPARSSYVQSHTLTAVRLPDLAVVPLDGFTLAADRDSIGWTLNATGPISILAQLAPAAGVPARLRVTLDGLAWEFIVEGRRRDRRFGEVSASITGRSVSALLTDRYAPAVAYLNSVDMTAQQLVLDALLFTGVGLDWRADDWFVPAGAWSHTGTPMSAALRVAEAAGSTVQSPRVGDNLIVMPKYPSMPWEWDAAVPDVVLASLDPVDVEGYEEVNSPAYEGVYVSGQAQGVLVLVKRAGTAPSLYMPMVTDPLMTHVTGAVQRGRALLGPGGARGDMTLSLPVLTGVGEPGVIDPGKLVHVADPEGAWRGLVRSVRVTVAPPAVDQVITLERHL